MKIMILANDDAGLFKFRKELITELLKKNDLIISVPYGKFVNSLKDIGCMCVNTPVDRRGMNPFVDIKLLRSYITLLKKEKPELVITYTIKPNIYGGVASRIMRIPYDINITGLGSAFENGTILKKIAIFMNQIALKKAKTVFFENSENQHFFIDKSIVKKRQTFLLNGAGVNLEYYHNIDYPEYNGKTQFLFIGRIMKEKGIEELLYAVKRLRDENYNCHLNILGEYEEDYTNIIKEYEEKGWLKYHGYQKDVRPFIMTAHCFVLPSWHEGMANTNLECASCGRPIITSNIPGCKEAVKDGVSGFLVECKNPENLYQYMKKFILLTFNEKKHMGMEGRRHMERYFDKKNIVKATIDRL